MTFAGREPVPLIVWTAAKLRLKPPSGKRTDSSLRCVHQFSQPRSISRAPVAKTCFIRHDRRPWGFLVAPFTAIALGAGLQVGTPDPGGPTAIEQALIEHACPLNLTRAE